MNFSPQIHRSAVLVALLTSSLYSPFGFGRSESTSEQVANVRSLLSARISPDATNLAEAVLVGLNANARENSIPSSYFFKSLLEAPAQNVFFTQQYGSLPVIDATMSEQQVIAQKRKIEDRSCLDGFAKLVPGGISEVDSALAFIKERLVPEADRKRQSTRKLEKHEMRNAGSLDLVLSDILTPEQRSQFGSVHDYEQNGPAIRTLRLTHSTDRNNSSDLIPYSKRTVLSLSMLTSVRTGQDKAFIGAQSCLLDLWSAQEWEFGTRLGNLLSNGKRGTKVASERYNALLFGRSFSSTAMEIDFLKTHLSNIGKVKPYLQERLAGAVHANRLLSQLSPQQLDKLIDLFLTLSSPEFKTSWEIETLSKRARENGDNRNLDAELIHARQSSRDLVALELNAIKERSLKAQEEAELAALKQMR